MERGGEQVPAGGRRRERRSHRALAWASAVLTAVLVAGALTAYAEYRSLFGSIARIRVIGLGNRPPSYNTALNILVIGSDSRKGIDARFGKHIAGQRSDTVMVLHLSPGRSAWPGCAARPGRADQRHLCPGRAWLPVEVGGTCHAHPARSLPGAQLQRV